MTERIWKNVVNKITLFCFDDSFVTLTWLCTCSLHQLHDEPPGMKVLNDHPEVLSTCLPLCFHFVVQLITNHLNCV